MPVSVPPLEDLNKDIELKESYILFICKNDPFEENGLPCYTFRNTCEENPLVNLNDKSLKVIYNASAYAEEKDIRIQEFLRYVITNEAGDDDFTKRLASIVENLKDNEKFRSDYIAMNLHDWDLTIRAKEAGAEEKAIEAATNLLKMNLGTPEQISKATNLPIEKVLELKKEISAE